MELRRADQINASGQIIVLRITIRSTGHGASSRQESTERCERARSRKRQQTLSERTRRHGGTRDLRRTSVSSRLDIRSR